jgi:hypothetical protein
MRGLLGNMRLREQGGGLYQEYLELVSVKYQASVTKSI